jgi:hypothetical protein
MQLLLRLLHSLAAGCWVASPLVGTLLGPAQTRGIKRKTETTVHFNEGDCSTPAACSQSVTVACILTCSLQAHVDDKSVYETRMADMWACTRHIVLPQIKGAGCWSHTKLPAATHLTADYLVYEGAS